MQRRNLLAAGLAGLMAGLAGQASAAKKDQCEVCDKPPANEAALAARPVGADGQMVKCPVIWDGKKMYETFAAADARGNAVHYPGPESRRKAYVAFDPQCKDCATLMAAMAPLYDYVDVAWFPIAYLNIHSDPQGALILSAKVPWEKMEEHHDHFHDKEFRGLRYNLAELSEAVRGKVWENTKMHRRCGCRAVPFGVYRNSKGAYMAFDESLRTQDLMRLFELK